MMKRCPHCTRELEPTRGIQTYRSPSRPGGRQLSFERTVRTLAWDYLDEGIALTEAQAMRKARRVLTRALPAKQKAPRQRSQLRDAA